MTTTNGTLPHISDANAHFHNSENWQIDRTSKFLNPIYITEWGETMHYRLNEIPVDVRKALLGGDNTIAEEHSPLDECVEIPSVVYSLLPDFYTQLLDFFPTKEEKDVFLCGMLPTIASVLPNVQGAHADGYYSTDIFLALVASAGQGKGTAAKAFTLAQAIDDELRYRSEQDILSYQAREAALEKGEKITEQPPPEKCHIIPANASAIAMMQALYDNDGRALVAETEIDSMLASDRNADWGNISSILRSAFHHEAISVKRKSAHRGKTMLKIERPSLSVFLSGTPNQFQELMHSTENGLFSRFAVYYHNPKIEWRTHRPTKQSMERVEAISRSAQMLRIIYLNLVKREDIPPVHIVISDAHWDAIDKAFSTLQNEFYHDEQRPDLMPSARRGAIIAFRLAMQFALLRWYNCTDENEFSLYDFLSKEENATIYATDEDITCAIHLARTFTYHAQALSSLLPRTTKAVSSSKASVMRFLEALPNEFTTDESVQIGAGLHLSRPTVFRYIKQLSGNYIQAVRHGKYHKVSDSIK